MCCTLDFSDSVCSLPCSINTIFVFLSYLCTMLCNLYIILFWYWNLEWLGCLYDLFLGSSSYWIQRVKVYRLNDDGKWDDQGTGHVTVDYLEVCAPFWWSFYLWPTCLLQFVCVHTWPAAVHAWLHLNVCLCLCSEALIFAFWIIIVFIYETYSDCLYIFPLPLHKNVWFVVNNLTWF